MSEEEKNGSDNLDNSIDGEFKSGEDGAQGETKSDNDGLGTSGSESDLRAKKQRLQTPSPKPSPLPFMVQGIIVHEHLVALAKGIHHNLFITLLLGSVS